jgi:hypothetical protein
MAHDLGLEFEYYLAIRTAKVSRPISSTSEQLPSLSGSSHPPEVSTVAMDLDTDINDELASLSYINFPNEMPIDFSTEMLDHHSLETMPYSSIPPLRMDLGAQEGSTFNQIGPLSPPLRHMSSTPPTASSEIRAGNPLGVYSILNPQTDVVEKQRDWRHSECHTVSMSPIELQPSNNLSSINRPTSVDSTQTEPMPNKPFQPPSRPPPKHMIPADVPTAFKGANETRKRNMGAAARFRARWKEKEREILQRITRIEQQIREAHEDVEYYRTERDYFKAIVYQQPGAERHYSRPTSPHLRRTLVLADFAPHTVGTSIEEISPANSPFCADQQNRTTRRESYTPSHLSPSGSHWVSDYSNGSERAPSRASSAASMQSHRGRSSVRRWRTKSRTSSQGELVFEANPGRSQSRNSGASGRRGPLDSISKAAMNAVKRVGACWRCKILRKTVSQIIRPHSNFTKLY